MEIVKLIKKPIGHTKIEYYVTVDGQTTSEAIDYAIENICRITRTVVTDDQDPEEVLRDKLGDNQYQLMLQEQVMARISPFVISAEEELDMAFEPQCSSDSIPQRDEDFEFTITVLLRPKYTLDSLDPVEITVTRPKVSEEAIDQQLEQITDLNTIYKTVEDDGAPMQMGQFVVINMRTTKNGMEIGGLTGDNRLLELSYGFMPEGFIDNIVGMKIGETKTFDFEGPREGTLDENDTEVYTTTVTLKERKIQEIPELTDEWVEENMTDMSTVEELRTKVREALEAQAQEQAAQNVGQMVDAELAKRFHGSIPDEIYEAASRSVYQSMLAGLRQEGKTIDDLMQEQNLTQDQINLQVMLQSREIIRQGLSLDRLFDEKIGELTDEDIEDAYKSFAPGHEAEARQQFEETGRLYAVKEVAKRLKAHKWLLDTAIINYRDAADEPAQPANDGQGA